MRLAHLTSSTLYGGPERQMLGLARHLPSDFRTTFFSFSEAGRCRDFLRVVNEDGFDAVELANDTPKLRAATKELTQALREREIEVLLCHGYKANLIGRLASRRVGIPAVAVSRGWTWESLKVRMYESLDRRHLRFMDQIVCVSDGQAEKVRRVGVPARKIRVIRNSARLEAFTTPNPADRERLRSLFSSDTPLSQILLAAGRLSPEKGFEVLVEAAAKILSHSPFCGFVLFGEGPERASLERRIQELGMTSRFLMPGFSRELDCLVPWADALVLPSYTEGLPNVVLEASAAGVPVVATAVGGTPEVVVDGETGFLIPAGDADALAHAVRKLLADESLRRRFGEAGRERMQARFSFAGQATAYVKLLNEHVTRRCQVPA